MSEVHFQNIGRALSDEFGTTAGQMFGKPCFKTPGNKAFAAFFKGEMVFKLGKVEVDQLKDKYAGSVNWDPSGKGRPMKDWIQVPEEFQEDWQDLARNAFAFVANA